MPAARPSAAVIRNAIQAAQDCGLPIGAVEITRDGSVRILATVPGAALRSGAATGENTCDSLFGGESR